MKVEGHDIVVEGKFLKIAKFADEWYEDVKNPEMLKRRIKDSELKADILTFWQRFPDNEPTYDYLYEYDYIAALQIISHDYWWKKQIKSRTRGIIRKAYKQGIVVRECEFNDDFIHGMTEIFNESSIRQGKPFWHYGKDFKTIKKDFSRFLFRETLIGAFYKDEMIGFLMLADAGKYSLTGQIISKIAHRDKSPNNALIDKAVEICSQKKMPYLVYFFWSDDDLSEFKRRCGFEKIAIPRYYIPLTAKGRLALKMNYHRGIRGILPEEMVKKLKSARRKWYDWKTA